MRTFFQPRVFLCDARCGRVRPFWSSRTLPAAQLWPTMDDPSALSNAKAMNPSRAEIKLANQLDILIFVGGLNNFEDAPGASRNHSPGLIEALAKFLTLRLQPQFESHRICLNPIPGDYVFWR